MVFLLCLLKSIFVRIIDYFYMVFFSADSNTEYGMGLSLLLSLVVYIFSLSSYVWKYTFGGPVDLTDHQRVLLGVKNNGMMIFISDI